MITLLMLFAVLMPGSYQDDFCGNGLPCGPVPWPVPQLPIILSPTPIPTAVIQATAVPSDPTSTPQPTSTPIPTIPDEQIDTDDLEDVIGDIEDIVNQTAVPDFGNVDGTEIGWESADSLSTSAFWGLVRGLLGINIGVFQPVFVAGIIAVFTITFVKSTTLILPVVAFAIGMIRKAVEFVVKFIPGLG